MENNLNFEPKEDAVTDDIVSNEPDEIIDEEIVVIDEPTTKPRKKMKIDKDYLFLIILFVLIIGFILFLPKIVNPFKGSTIYNKTPIQKEEKKENVPNSLECMSVLQNSDVNAEVNKKVNVEFKNGKISIIKETTIYKYNSVDAYNKQLAIYNNPKGTDTSIRGIMTSYTFDEAANTLTKVTETNYLDVENQAYMPTDYKSAQTYYTDLEMACKFDV